MDKVSWLVPIEAAIKELLADRKAVLESWRRAVGTKRDGRVWKFENWLVQQSNSSTVSLHGQRRSVSTTSRAWVRIAVREEGHPRRQGCRVASDDAAGWAVDARGDRL